jgi:hypothetical protein
MPRKISVTGKPLPDKASPMRCMCALASPRNWAAMPGPAEPALEFPGSEELPAEVFTVTVYYQGQAYATGQSIAGFALDQEMVAVRDQKSVVRSQKSELRSQRSGVGFENTPDL